MSLDAVFGRSAYTEDHEAFRQTVRSFLTREGVPNVAQWESDRLVPREIWRSAGEIGMLCPTVPEAYGGLGLDFGYNAIVNEELAYNGVPAGFTLQSDIVCGYIEHYGSEEQKAEWLPRLVSGETITAIAMTEPGTGSDLQAIRTTAKKAGNHYVVNGSKTYITNGQNADLVLVVAKTDPDAQPAYKGMSIILIEADREGFRRGRKLDKIGQDAADTSELFFDDVRVPITHCLGEEGKGLHLPDEPVAAGTAVDRGRRTGVGTKGVRRDGRVHQIAQSFCGHGVRFPEHPLRARRPQGQAAGRLGASRLGDPAASGGRTLTPDRRRGGETVAYRATMGSDGQMPPAPWRSRLHERISDRPRLARGPREPHLRRHQRDHEGAYRSQPVAFASADCGLTFCAAASTWRASRRHAA